MIATADIIEALGHFSSEERSEKSKTMYPTSMKVMGVTNPDIKKVLQSVYTSMKAAPGEEIIDLASKLIAKDIIECQMLAWLLLEKMKMVRELRREDLERLTGVLDNWVSVDTFGVTVYGILWRINTITDKEVMGLQESEDVWLRRLALLATVALNLRSRGGNGDVIKTLMICKQAVGDHHDMVVKALSWALRSLIIWDKVAVRSFLETHHEKLHKRVLREVSHKLDHGTKN